MKARHSYPSGQTTASRLKALLACVEREQGSAAADAWLASARVARRDLDDETRLLPLAAFHAGLVALVARLPDGLERAAGDLASRENLGAWIRVLRGARAPEEAFAHVDASDGEHASTSRWETIEARPGRWRGRVVLSHDPKLEEDGLLARARQVELSVVPTLFGYERGTVTVVGSADGAQEFAVVWAVPSAPRAAAIGAASAAVAGAAVVAAHPSAISAGVGVALSAGGAALAWTWARARRTRAEARGQAIRILALERSLQLREREPEAVSGAGPGAVVAGQYRIGERLGSGASGVIYEAVRIADGHPVAIKLLRAATAHDVSASDRLRRESEALGLSWHPNVVEVVDHGHLPDGTSYLAMELLRGETLATRLGQRRRLSPTELLPIAQQIAEALVAVHAAGVVHRDLKPSNIYLVPDPEAPEHERVKVFDFGIARVEWEELRITNMGAPLGTPGYMSPEQEHGLEVDHRSDVYAFGALLYECLVGEPPPASPNERWSPGARSSIGIRGRAALAGEEPMRSGVVPASPRLPSVAPLAAQSAPVAVIEVAAGWRALVEQALAVRPDDRFQDARALLAALRALAPTAPAAPAVPKTAGDA